MKTSSVRRTAGVLCKATWISTLLLDRRRQMNYRCALCTCVTAFLLGATPIASAAQTYSVTDLGVVSGASYSYPKAINDNHGAGPIRVVGSTADKNGSFYHGFYWDSNGIKDLGVLTGASTSNAEAVNSLGEVVGWSGASGGTNRVAIYRNFGSNGPLPQLPYPALTPDGSGPFAN